MNGPACECLNNRTPLHAAAEGDRGAIVGLLLQAGADANALTATGESPLILAARRGNFSTIKILLDYPGINLNVNYRSPVDRDMTAFEILVAFGIDGDWLSADSSYRSV